jgi:hypothetical protein
VFELTVLLVVAFLAGYGLRSYLSYRRRGMRAMRYPYY